MSNKPVTVKDLVTEAFSKVINELSSDEIDAKRRAQRAAIAKKHKPGSTASFTHSDGSKQSGTFKGFARRGAHTYAKIDHGNQTHHVPLHHVHV